MNSLTAAIWVEELRKYTPSELQELFGQLGNRSGDVLRELRRTKVLRPTDLRDLESHPSFAGQEVDREPSGHGERFVFQFVGLVVVHGVLVFCYPKYFGKARPAISSFKLILRVIERDGQGQLPLSALLMDENKPVVGQLSTRLFLLRDYHENGLYTNYHDVHEVNGLGEIDWRRTVDFSLPFIGGGQLIYPELYTRRRVGHEADFFARLHAALLARVSSSFQETGLLDLFDLTAADVPVEDGDLLNDADYVLWRIRGELDAQFDSRKQVLLKAMHALVVEEGGESDIETAHIFGTRHFYGIWERVCRAVLGSHLTVVVDDIEGLEPEWVSENSGRQLISFIERPRWEGADESGNFGRLGKGTLQPDLVLVDRRLSGAALVILDAKYYDLVLERDRPLANYPGVEDVVKQYMYQRALQGFVEANGISVVENYFLMPTVAETVENVGVVALDMLSSLGLSDIEIRKLPAERMFSLFLEGRQIELAELVAAEYAVQ